MESNQIKLNGNSPKINYNASLLDYIVITIIVLMIMFMMFISYQNKLVLMC